MDIYQELAEKALSLARGKKIKRIVLSPFYALAEIEKGGMGLSYVDKDFLNSCCGENNHLSYWGKPADLLIKPYLISQNQERFLSLAVMNALFNHRKEILNQASLKDPLEILPLSPEKEILMIGYFEPIFKKLQGKVKRIWIIEKGDETCLPSSLKDLSLAIITSATLANKSFHTYLSLLEKIPEVILMGPSTPLVPEIFKFTPITWLSGVVVKDRDLLFKLVCEGKGTQAFFKSKSLEKVNLRIK